ncbi:MAG: DEAD/DEAH box helicase [Prevotella sp.]|nr:DEAD/DEAH box helicase [Prevotella sp.]
MRNELLNKVLGKLGINQLSMMQQEAEEHILRGRHDVVILSPTGSGKTLAYLLPLVQLLDASSNEVQALVVLPSRELALQSDTVMKSMGSGLRSQSCYGGRAAMDEHRILKHNMPQLVFGTPGRLNDHLDKGNIDAHHIKYIIIDEFDKCLEMGFQDEMSKLINSLPALERRILLSATDAEQIPQFVEMHSTDRLDFLVDEESVSERVQVYRVDSPEKDKLGSLAKLLLSLGEGQSIVFLNYRDSVVRTDEFLRQQGFSTSAFHGGMDQRQREDALYKFSNGSAMVLVSTDLASRGLDIPQIDNIIHYHLPLNEEAMVHRVGRTARWDSSGKTFFLIGPDEHLPEFVQADVETYEMKTGNQKPAAPRMATLYIGKGKKDKISKGDIVGFLCKKGGLQTSEVGRIDVAERYAYVAVRREKLQQVIKLTRGEKIKGIRTIVEPVR